ncbi:MAG: hypothetical protein ACTSU3_06725, partial [Candidatus Thorarchaeota archaeon]
DADLATQPPPIFPPSTEDMEAQILGSMSTIVSKDQTELDQVVADTMAAPAGTGFAPAVADDFSSSKYETSPEIETLIPEDIIPVPDTPSVEETDPTSIDLDVLIPCPKCGEIVSKDMFEYPKEVYSAMGTARLKQVRFFIVQGKYKHAQKIIRIARELYQKAGDTEGVTEIDRIMESIVQKS